MKKFFEGNENLLSLMIKDKYVKVNKHPVYDLYIYSYTVKTVDEKKWNIVTERCRGLVLDGKMHAVAVPFFKFYNHFQTPLEKLNELKDIGYTAYEKLDGSLCNLFFVNDIEHFSSSSSFNSAQTNKALEIFNKKYKNACKTVIVKDNSITHIFEIIYPKNRIVVDYGDTEDLFLIGLRDNNTGKLIDIYGEYGNSLPFRRPNRIIGKGEFLHLVGGEWDRKEGYVLVFDDGTLLKLKYKEYFEYHFRISKLSSYEIWKHLQRGKYIKTYLKDIPDECYSYAHSIEKKIKDSYRKFKIKCKNIIKVYCKNNKFSINDAKDISRFWLHVNEMQSKNIITASELYVVMLLLRNNHVKARKYIYDCIKPEYERYGGVGEMNFSNKNKTIKI